MFNKLKHLFRADSIVPQVLPSAGSDKAIEQQNADIAARFRQQDLRALLQKRQTSEYFYMIDVVGGCNLRCPSCAVGNYPQNEAKGLMKVETYEKILAKIAQEHPGERVFIHLYNWGEPALHKQLSKIIDLTKSFGFGSGISCNLNTFPNIAEVVKSAPTYIRISLSGFVNETYQKNHRRGDINLVKSNMHLLRYHLDKTGSDTIVEVGYHVYRSNFPDDFFRMRQLCIDLDFIFAPTLASMSPVEKSVRAIDGLPLDPDSQSMQANLVIPMKRRTEILQSARERYPDCQFRKTSTTINFDGSVPLCCATYERPQLIADNFLETSRAELRKRKYRHPFCGVCQTRNLDLLYTGANPQVVDKEAIAVLGEEYEKFLAEWNVTIEPRVIWQGERLSVQFACDLALSELSAGAVHNTKALFTLVMQAAPDHAEAQFQLGKIAEIEGDTAAASFYCAQAIKLYPGHAPYVAHQDALARRIAEPRNSPVCDAAEGGMRTEG